MRAELRISTTTEVFVLEAARTLVFRGAVDDRYGVGWSRDEARARYLVDALEAVKSDRTVEIAATTAPGCALEPESVAASLAVPPTFHNRISRVFQAHCQQCHH